MKDDDIDSSPVMECPNCSSSGLISATVYWASRSNQYIAAAVDCDNPFSIVKYLKFICSCACDILVKVHIKKTVKINKILFLILTSPPK